MGLFRRYAHASTAVGPWSKAGVIYLLGVTKEVEEIIFPEARGVTPDIDTKQAKKIFSKIVFRGMEKYPKKCFWPPPKKSKIFDQFWIFETKDTDLRGSAASEEKTQKNTLGGGNFFRVMMNRNFELFEHLNL